MTTLIRTIQVSGFTNKNTACLWDGTEIITATSFDVADFDFGDETENEFEKCKAFIKAMENKEDGWIPGYVTCYIDTFEFETEEND